MILHLLHLKSLSILEQLKIEEALLREDTHNWCIINEGSSPAIVMGISGKIHEHLNVSKVAHDQVPVIQRFSGGGTVFVDENTLFVTFLYQKNTHPFFPYPEAIMRWTEKIYKPVFSTPSFRLRENDYVLDEKKCGGNAQYLRKDRWLHHTSFLWDFHPHKMDYLLFPKKTPQYRLGRSHQDFLCRLSDHFFSKNDFLSRLKENLGKQHSVLEVSLEKIDSFLSFSSRQTTRVVPLNPASLF